MALTTEQWFLKIREHFPSWFISRETGSMPVIEAVVYGLAAIAHTLQTDAEAERDRTFITRSSGTMVDAHADERGIVRVPGETDSALALRTRTLSNAVTYARLKTLIDTQFPPGTESILRANFEYGPFLGTDDSFLGIDDGVMSLERMYNRFTLHIPKIPVLNTYPFYASLVQILDTNIALGVSYDVYSRAYTTESTGDPDDGGNNLN